MRPYTLMDIFNTREIALFIWIAILIGLLLLSKPIQKSMADVVEAALNWKVLTVFGAATLYTALIVWLLYWFHLWDFSQLKNSLLWLFTAGFASVFTARKEKTNLLKEVLKDIFKFTTLVEFLTSVYTFSLGVELVILPVVTFFAVLLPFSQQEKKYAPVTKLISGMLALIGLVLIFYSLYQIIFHFKSFATTGTLSDLLIPPTLSLLFIPFVYSLSLMMSYEENFIRINSRFKSKKLMRYAKRQAILNFGSNKDKLDRWSKYIFLNRVETKKEIRKSIKFINRLYKTEKNPPEILFEEGWSPYKAKHFVDLHGLPTGYYSPLTDGDWFASSEYLQLEKSDLHSSNISYSIEGTERVARKLTLRLNVNDSARSQSSHQFFLPIAEQLYKSATDQDMPEKAAAAILSGNPVTIYEGNRRITVQKNKWLQHQRKGYDVSLVISVTEEE